MFYNLNSWSDSEARVLRRDRLAPEGHQGHGTKDFRWDITRPVGGRRGDPGTRGWGLPWGYLTRLPETPQNGKDPRFTPKFKKHKSATRPGCPSQTAPFITPIPSMSEGLAGPGTSPRGATAYAQARTELSREFVHS